jgi:hypothetical protein
VTRAPLAATPIVAISLALMWSLGQVSAAGSAEQRFERLLAKSNSVAPPAYRAFRRLEGGLTNNPDKRGWLEVWTEYQPGRGFTFEVVREGGSEYIRNKTLRTMLATEQDLIARGKRLRASLDANNYAFEDGGVTDGGLQRILMNPRKKSDGLVQGSLLIEPGSGLITSMQGRLMKSPSFWLRDVDVNWKFAHVGTHVVPIEMTSTGRVRMFGRSNFRMVYEYDSIDGRSTGTALKAALREEQP